MLCLILIIGNSTSLKLLFVFSRTQNSTRLLRIVIKKFLLAEFSVLAAVVQHRAVHHLIQLLQRIVVVQLNQVLRHVLRRIVGFPRLDRTDSAVVGHRSMWSCLLGNGLNAPEFLDAGVPDLVHQGVLLHVFVLLLVVVHHDGEFEFQGVHVLLVFDLRVDDEARVVEVAEYGNVVENRVVVVLQVVLDPLPVLAVQRLVVVELLREPHSLAVGVFLPLYVALDDDVDEPLDRFFQAASWRFLRLRNGVEQLVLFF